MSEYKTTQVRLDFVLRAKEPISHSSGNKGNHAIFMRESIMLPDGEVVDIPCISGDALRHQLREAMAYITLDALDMLGQGGLSQGALRLLFAGGGIGGAQGASIDLDAYDKMVRMVPGVGLLGGGVGNRIMPGQIEVKAGRLICDETVEAGVLPAWAAAIAYPRDAVPPAAGDCVATETRVRMDPMDRPGKRTMLSDAAQAEYAERILAGAGAKDAKAKDDAKGTMMPRSTEVVVAGALFHWGIVATLHTQAQEHAFWAMLGAALSDLKVGGKRGTGHGSLAVVACQQHEWMNPIASAKAINPLGISGAHVDAFRAALAPVAEDARAFLAKVDA